MKRSLRFGYGGIALYLSVFSHTTVRERLGLFQAAKSLPSGANALEIGSHLGSSALFLCAGLKQNNGHLFCVDTWMNETMPDGGRDTFSEFVTNTEPFSAMIKSIRKHSSELKFEDFGVDLDFAFIDGDHSEFPVRADFKLVSSWIRVGGFVAFHDVHPIYPGVSIVIGEALASGSWQLAALIDSLGLIRRVK